MNGLDTNILVRYLVQDDPRQAAQAAVEIEGAAGRGEKLLIQPLVLCELVWVLETAYEFGKADILGALERIVRVAQFEIADKDTVWEAIADYGRGRADFSDYYLGHANAKAGADVTLTFDKSLRGNMRFKVLGA